MKCPRSRPFWLENIKKNLTEIFRKFEIRVLVHMAAASCGRKAPSMRGMNSRKRLMLFRNFTVDAVRSCSGEDLSSFRDNMYRRAFRVGRLLALLPGLNDTEKRKRLIIMLYRNIGIVLKDGNDDADGCIHIPHCSFSSAYTPEICKVMSGMDAGIICGIFGGGKLEFSQRITEGCPYCRALYRN